MSNRRVPIVVVGAAHSGTTILYRMLAMHPDVTWFSQYSQRSGTIPGRVPLPVSNHIDKALRRVLQIDWGKNRGGWRSIFVPTPSEADKIWGYVFPEDGAISSAESIQRLRNIVEAETDFWQTPYIIAKLPRLYRHIPLIREAYPQSRFIHIVRDGRAVALSLRHKYTRLGKSQTEGLRCAATHWTEVINQVHQSKANSAIHELRYEDFCANVHDNIAEIIRETGLEVERFPFEKVPGSLSVSNPKWLRDLQPPDQEILTSTAGYYLEHYGYTTS